MIFQGSRQYVLLGGLSLLCLMLYLWARSRTDDFIVSQGHVPGWVVIELQNDECPAVDRLGLVRRFVVPESHYLCTSEPLGRNAVMERYFVDDGRGAMQRVRIGQSVHLRNVSTYSTEKCTVTAITFWLGPEEAISGEAKGIIAVHHPDCSFG